MKCDRGKLQALIDDTLSAQERAEVTAHLDGCFDCQATLAALRRQGTEVARRLNALDMPPDKVPQPRQAMAHFWAAAEPAGRTQPRPAPRWRWAAAAATFVAVIAILFSFAPVREAAAQFLGVFRVRKFAVISIDPQRLEQLAQAGSIVEQMVNKPAFLREPGPMQPLTGADEASALADFRVRTPSFLPEGAVQADFSLQPGPMAQITMNREQMEAILQAAGATDVPLPEAEAVTATADFAAIVEQSFRIGESADLMIVQSPGPVVTLQPDMDPAILGESLLRFLGLSKEDARRLAKEIDWTSTMILPLPTNLVQFREVGVDGEQGVLLIGSENGRQNAAVLWQHDDVVYAVAGNGVSPEVLLQVADSLQ